MNQFKWKVRKKILDGEHIGFTGVVFWFDEKGREKSKTKLFRGRTKGKKKEAERWAESEADKLNQKDPDLDVPMIKMLEEFVALKQVSYYIRSIKGIARADEELLNKSVADYDIKTVTRLLRSIVVNSIKDRPNCGAEFELIRAALRNFYLANGKHKHEIPINEYHAETFGKAQKKKKNTQVVDFDPAELPLALKALKEQGSDKHQFEIIHYYIARFTAIYGLRISETLGFEWKDINLDSNEIRLTGQIQNTDKHGRVIRNHKVYRLKEEGEMTGYIPFVLTPEVREMLQEIYKLDRNKRFIFSDKKGNVPQYSAVARRFKRVGFFSEKGTVTHKLRKTAGTMAHVHAGAEASKQLLRHSNDDVNKRYKNQATVNRNSLVPEILSELTKITEE